MDNKQTKQNGFILILYALLRGAINNVTFGKDVAFVSSAWVFSVWLKVVSISTAGHFVAKEANEAIVISYNILNNVEMRTNYERFKEDLEDLPEQVARCNKCSTASEFFVVNLTMMGYILSSATSYIIVAVKFF